MSAARPARSGPPRPAQGSADRSADRSVAFERIARHGLADRPCASVVDAVRRTTALQAQDPVAGRLGVRARCAAVGDAAVRRAIDVEHTIVKTTVMRGTIHLIAAEDVPWMTALIGPAVARSFAKRWADLGLTGAVLSRTAALIPLILADGPRSRAEIAEELTARGMPIDSADRAAITHVLLHATTKGLVCRAPDRGRQPTFTLLDQWLGSDSPAASEGIGSLRGDDALAELGRRYFAAYSPATPADFTTWSGLPSGRAVGLIRDELEPVDVHGRPGFRLGSAPPEPSRPTVSGQRIRLAPAFDNYLVGYRDRTAVIDPAHVGEVYVGGIIRPTVLLDGRVVGRWKVGPTARRTAAGSPADEHPVEVTLFEDLPAPLRHALAAEIADVQRFLAM